LARKSATASGERMGYWSTVVKLGRFQQCDGGGCQTGMEGGMIRFRVPGERERKGGRKMWPLPGEGRLFKM
jgi:hypothetical protein